MWFDVLKQQLIEQTSTEQINIPSNNFANAAVSKNINKNYHILKYECFVISTKERLHCYKYKSAPLILATIYSVL